MSFKDPLLQASLLSPGFGGIGIKIVTPTGDMFAKIGGYVKNYPTNDNEYVGYGSAWFQPFDYSSTELDLASYISEKLALGWSQEAIDSHITTLGAYRLAIDLEDPAGSFCLVRYDALTEIGPWDDIQVPTSISTLAVDLFSAMAGSKVSGLFVEETCEDVILEIFGVASGDIQTMLKSEVADHSDLFDALDTVNHHIYVSTESAPSSTTRYFTVPYGFFRYPWIVQGIHFDNAGTTQKRAIFLSGPIAGDRVEFTPDGRGVYDIYGKYGVDVPDAPTLTLGSIQNLHPIFSQAVAYDKITFDPGRSDDPGTVIHTQHDSAYALGGRILVTSFICSGLPTLIDLVSIKGPLVPFVPATSATDTSYVATTADVMIRAALPRLAVAIQQAAVLSEEPITPEVQDSIDDLYNRAGEHLVLTTMRQPVAISDLTWKETALYAAGEAAGFDWADTQLSEKDGKVIYVSDAVAALTAARSKGKTTYTFASLLQYSAQSSLVPGARVTSVVYASVASGGTVSYSADIVGVDLNVVSTAIFIDEARYALLNGARLEVTHTASHTLSEATDIAHGVLFEAESDVLEAVNASPEIPFGYLRLDDLGLVNPARGLPAPSDPFYADIIGRALLTHKGVSRKSLENTGLSIFGSALLNSGSS